MRHNFVEASEVIVICLILGQWPDSSFEIAAIITRFIQTLKLTKDVTYSKENG